MRDARGVDPEQDMREAANATKKGLHEKWVMEARTNVMPGRSS